MSKTKIDWATDVWNPVTGCTPAGAGCVNCYAKGIAKRFWGDRQFSEVKCHEDRLDQPLRWRKPRTIFVNSMGDLFHKDVPSGFIIRIICRINHAHWHRFIVLTKRPQIMRDFFSCHKEPPKNLILGVSASTQSEVDRAVPLLLDTPAACRCVSLEPLLGPVDLSRYLGCDHKACGDYGAARCDHQDCQSRYLRWVIVGGETGANARPMYSTWVRTVRDQCKAAGTAFFFKQWGEWLPSDTICSQETRQWHCGHRGAEGERYSVRVGKARAGHLLDGKEHREVPEVLK